MIYRLLAEGVLLLHAVFVAYAVLGALVVLRWRWTAALHLPALAWAGWVELAGRICPLTPLENYLRGLAGERGYSGGFLEHYLLSLLYPEVLTRATQIRLGIGLFAVNLVLYALVLRQRRRRDQVQSR